MVKENGTKHKKFCTKNSKYYINNKNVLEVSLWRKREYMQLLQ